MDFKVFDVLRTIARRVQSIDCKVKGRKHIDVVNVYITFENK
jgi:hypothetical protein